MNVVIRVFASYLISLSSELLCERNFSFQALDNSYFLRPLPSFQDLDFLSKTSAFFLFMFLRGYCILNSFSTFYIAECTKHFPNTFTYTLHQFFHAVTEIEYSRV